MPAKNLALMPHDRDRRARAETRALVEHREARREIEARGAVAGGDPQPVLRVERGGERHAVAEALGLVDRLRRAERGIGEEDPTRAGPHEDVAPVAQEQGLHQRVFLQQRIERHRPAREPVGREIKRETARADDDRERLAVAARGEQQVAVGEIFAGVDRHEVAAGETKQAFFRGDGEDLTVERNHLQPPVRAEGKQLRLAVVKPDDAATGRDKHAFAGVLDQAHAAERALLGRQQRQARLEARAVRDRIGGDHADFIFAAGPEHAGGVAVQRGDKRGRDRNFFAGAAVVEKHCAVGAHRHKPLRRGRDRGGLAVTVVVVRRELAHGRQPELREMRINRAAPGDGHCQRGEKQQRAAAAKKRDRHAE